MLRIEQIGKTFHVGGAPVHAVAPGRVVHAGWFKGYGNLVIVKHNGTYLTAYAHNQTLLVKEDHRLPFVEFRLVLRGGVLAETPATTDACGSNPSGGRLKVLRCDCGDIAPRVLELVYTAWDLRPFAEDMGYHGEPFRWDEERRAHHGGAPGPDALERFLCADPGRGACGAHHA